MKKSRFTEKQIIGFLRLAEAGMPVDKRGRIQPVGLLVRSKLLETGDLEGMNGRLPAALPA